MFYNIWPRLFRGRYGLMICAVVFSVGYGFIEYYVIQDTTFGLKPVLFSLIYPYHFLMGAAFGLASYIFLRLHATTPMAALSGLVLTGAVFSSMLVLEDFTWFTLRATAPLADDINGGSLVIQGEWSTRFLGSMDAHFTAVPNWYFMNALFTLAVVVIMNRSRPKIAVTMAGTA